ncbi:hypothetical protein TSUD_238230 [Trifolium subterraneum]|uniref:Polysaccharide biosynthesis protein C-terminal domain-containing protein n=1 Tax=Trifolium subterraneum TaxID=3900 RepID=A0A2Z6NFZ6_TRISU|nr:hypothetical protein TSUD_238230 [Trifolium subterraneum]
MPNKELASPLGEAKVPLLLPPNHVSTTNEDEEEQKLTRKVWIESKKLWHIVGPAIFSRIASYSMLVITQAFAGHLGDLELAAISIANNVVVGFDFGLLFQFGVIGTAATLNFSWWALTFGLFGYTVWGGLENWYYRILILMTGNLPNAEIAVDALSICMTINGMEMMIPLAFFAATGVRVANELGAGNGKGAKFATIVSVITSLIIGLFFWMLILILHNKFGYIFTTSKVVLDEVSKLSLLLAFTILLNSVQPVLSGVAVGSGWQSYVAYINLGCYYIIGVPLGFIMGWVFNQGVMGIWAGMIFGGTATQTLILCWITLRCDWDKEAEKAKLHITKWSDRKQQLR